LKDLCEIIRSCFNSARAAPRSLKQQELVAASVAGRIELRKPSSAAHPTGYRRFIDWRRQRLTISSPIRQPGVEGFGSFPHESASVRERSPSVIAVFIFASPQAARLRRGSKRGI